MFVMGLGKIDNNNYASTLQGLYIDYVDNCGDFLSSYDARINICADASPSSSSCGGDSGGPVLVPGTTLQIGSVSWGNSRDCEERQLVGYVRLSTHYDWIEQQICDLSSSPPPRCTGATPTAPTPRPTPVPTTTAPVTPRPTPVPTTTAPVTPRPTRIPTTAAPVTPRPTRIPTTAAPATPRPTLNYFTPRPTSAPRPGMPTVEPEPQPTVPTNTPLPQPTTASPSLVPTIVAAADDRCLWDRIIDCFTFPFLR